MAKRASLSGQKANALLNLAGGEGSSPAPADATVFDQIGDDTFTGQRVVEEVPLARLRANPYQPRWAIDEATVVELARSMQQRGFFGTLTARKRGRWYELAYGHQRLEAAHRAGLSALPVEVLELSDEEMVEYALAENLQRKDLSQLEEGEMFVRWQAELGRSERDIAERLGKSRGYIRNRIETARLPDDLKGILRAQVSRAAQDTEGPFLPPFELSPAAAKELARLVDPRARARLTSEVIERQLNFKETRSLVDSALHPSSVMEKRSPSSPPTDETIFGRLMSRLEEEARRIKPAERHEAIRALNELIARAEQIRHSLENQR